MKKFQMFLAVLSIGTLFWPAIAPAAQVPEIRSPSCAKIYAKWKTGKTHKAFAVTTISKKQHCGYSTHRSSVRKAEEVALQYCKKYGTCVISGSE